jgi:CRP-like cAMP-binding protein
LCVSAGLSPIFKASVTTIAFSQAGTTGFEAATTDKNAQLKGRDISSTMATVNIRKRLEGADLLPDVLDSPVETAGPLAMPALRNREADCTNIEPASAVHLRLPLAKRVLSNRAAFLQSSSLFRGLTLAECADIGSMAREIRYERREMVFREGDPVSSVSVLASGRAKITQVSRSGGEVILRVKSSGEVLGGLGMPPGAFQFLTAQTLEPCMVLLWESRKFEILEDRFPALRRNTVRIFAERLRTLEEQFLELATEQVAPRLARMLVRLASGDGTLAIRIDLSREEMAQMTGTTLFTVSRLLCDWEERGIIETQRKAVVIRDTRSLITLAESNFTSTQ